MITNDTLDWTSDDELNLRAFLATTSGKRLLPKVCESSPVNLPGGDTNDILIRSGEVRGFASAVATLLALSTRPPTAQVDVDHANITYPSLKDDAAWDDGQKTDAS
jgi:hypothetical protein